MLTHVVARQAWMRTAIRDEYEAMMHQNLSHVQLDGLMQRATLHLQACAECKAAINDPVDHPPQEAIRIVIAHLFQKTVVDPADQAGSYCPCMPQCVIL